MSEAELDRLIARWAQSYAPELIARTKAEALEVARARLRERFVDALIDAAARTEPEERPIAPLLWVYGVVRAGSFESLDVEGVDDAPVRLHRHAGVAALVSQVPHERFNETALSERLEELDSLEALARAHERVLQAAMESGAVVPFRLCTLYASPEGLDAMLERESLALTGALERLDGMEEWGVKAFLREPAAVAPSAGAPTGAEYLSRKREQRDAVEEARTETETFVAGIHARLAERAAAAVLSRPQDRRLSGRDAEMVLNAAYLVPRDGADAFRNAIAELARQHEADGIDLVPTGPWPAHHFVETPEP